ncbi:MAG TPA: ABC transporter permease [Terriglobales bacterium]|nr:ABC transporter permease [Terriglobales bacterium]
MKTFRTFLSRVAGIFGRQERDADFSAELDGHLQMHIDDFVRAGLSPGEARRQALLKLGGTEQVKEAYREQRGLPSLESFAQDVRFALRSMRKNPGFTLIAILTLMLGIGANTALFSVVNGVLLNPLPYPHPEQLALLAGKTTQFSRASVSYPNFLDWERDNKSFSSMGAFRSDDFSFTGRGEAERLHGYMISSGFFPTLQVRPFLGRDIRREEDQVGGAPVVEISQGLWKRKFGSSPSAVGQTIMLNGTSYTIIGVVPANFHLYSGSDPQVYVPIGQWNDPTFRDRRIGMGMNVVARLKPGITIAQAQSDMDRIARQLAAAYPEANASTGIAVGTLKQEVIGDESVNRTLYILLAAVAFVLLIACANVANLLLARSTGRAREFAVRSALGASKSRLVRQLLTESALLGLGGGVLGVLLAWQGTRAVLAILPDALPRADEVGIDPRVLGYALGLSLLSGLIFGLAPAFQIWRTNVQETLKSGGRGLSGARHRTLNAFVIFEVATALVLLVGAGLMIRSLAVLWNTDPGFDPHHVLAFNIAEPPIKGADAAQIRASLRSLEDRLHSIPGVQAVSWNGGSLPLDGSDSELPFWLQGSPKPSSDSDMDWALFYLVNSDDLKTMGIPLLRGRNFTRADNEHSMPVALIDEKLARQYFGDKDPIGQKLNLNLINMQVQIIGIVGHVKHWGLDTDSTNKIQSELYIPLLQIPDSFMPLLATGGMQFVLRSDRDPSSLISDLRHAVAQENPEAVVYGTKTFDQIISDSLAARRFSMTLLGIFAGLALLLSSIGIYGVIAYVVGQRVQEIGTRMALGAQRGDVLRMVLAGGAKLALTGVAIGSALALALTREMRQMIYGVSATDPLTFTGVALLLVIIALLACYIPARRAMKVDPMIALRYE